MSLPTGSLLDARMEGLALVLAEEEGISVMIMMCMKYLKAIWLFCSYLFVSHRIPE